MLKHAVIVLAFLIASLLFAIPLGAAPSVQSTLPNFTLNAQTVMSVTVAITDGQVIMVPIELTFIAQNEDGETGVTLIADVEQQAGLFIGVAPSDRIDATIQLPQSAAAAQSSSDSEADEEEVTGTHVANTNSNRRAGPGTNFQIVGRVPAGGAVTVVGENDDGTWLELDDGSWVAEFLLDPVPASADDDDDDGADEEADEEADEAAEEEANGENTEENNDEDSEEESGDNEDDQEADEEATATPTPTEPDVDQGDLETYLIQLITIGADATNAVDNLMALVEDPQPANPQWSNEVAAELATLSEALDQYLALTPVPGYDDLHAQVTEVALTCEQAVDYLAGGLEEPSSINTALAAQSIQACTAQASALSDEIGSLQ